MKNRIAWRPARSLAALVCVLASSWGTHAAEGTIPVKDFIRPVDYYDAKISPNGDYLAVRKPYGNREIILGMLDLKQMKLAGHLRLSQGEHVDDFWWVGPKRLVVSIGDLYGPLAAPVTRGELYGVDADGSHKQYLFGWRAGTAGDSLIKRPSSERAFAWLLDPLPHDASWALMQTLAWDQASCKDKCEIGELQRFGRPLIERIHVGSGLHKKIGVMPGQLPAGILADRAGMPRVAHASDGARQRLFTAADTPSGWKEVVDPQGAMSSIELHALSADGNRAFVRSVASGGRACLREFRIDSASFVEQSCTTSGTAPLPILSLDDSELIATAVERALPALEIVKPDHPDAQLLQKLHKAFGGQRLRITSRTLDGSRFVLLVEGDRNPGDFYLVDRQSNKVELLISRRAWIDPATMAPMMPIRYTTRDGATVEGYLTAQAGPKVRKAPLVVLPHGGPHGARDYWYWDPWGQALASRGYAVLQVNYRGSGGYGAAHEEVAYRKWHTLIQDDLTDAVKWAVDKGYADGRRVCMFGASFGAYSAVMSAAREPALYRCAVAFAGVYDIPALVRDSAAAESALGRGWMKKFHGEDFAAMQAASPVSYIASLAAPLLVAHGTSDRITPFNQAKRLRAALDEHKKAYEWLEFSGEEHGFYDAGNEELFLTKALEFLDRHIGAGAAGS